MDARVQAAIRYVEERLDKTVPLEAVADFVSLSPFHFHRLFRREVGESFYAYVKHIRMNGAAARLKWTSDGLMEIATAFGYSSNAAFSHAFAGYFGCSPKKFRNNASDGGQCGTDYPVNETIVVREIEAYWCLAKRYCGHYGMAHMHWHDFIDRLPAEFSRCDGNSHFVGLVHDRPQITSSDQIRYDCCWMFTTPSDPRITKADPSFQLLQTRPGRYALFEPEGSPVRREMSYSLILDEWLPTTDYVMADDPAIEIFRSAPTEASPEGLRLQILMPLK